MLYCCILQRYCTGFSNLSKASLCTCDWKLWPNTGRSQSAGLNSGGEFEPLGVFLDSVLWQWISGWNLLAVSSALQTRIHRERPHSAGAQYPHANHSRAATGVSGIHRAVSTETLSTSNSASEGCAMLSSYLARVAMVVRSEVLQDEGTCVVWDNALLVWYRNSC